MARWFAAKDLPSSWEYRPGMLLLGHDGMSGKVGRRLGVYENRHIVTIAGSRSGKTKTLLIPNLRDYPGSAVVIDPKGELALATAQSRRDLGQKVYILNPFPMPESRLPPSDHYNPFAGLNDLTQESLPAHVAHSSKRSSSAICANHIGQIQPRCCS
jgi:type IV secretion system protein VirD4